MAISIHHPNDDPLKEVRDVLGAPEPGSNLEPENFSQNKEIGTYSTFKTENLVVSILGNDNVFNAILLDSQDLRTTPTVSARHIVFVPDVMPTLLPIFLQAEFQAANLSSTPAEDRPEFPIMIGEAFASDGTSIKVLLTEWTGYIDVKVSKVIPGKAFVKGGQWAKWSVARDTRPILKMLLEAYDALTQDSGPSETPSEEGFGF